MGNYASLAPDASVDATLYYFEGRGRADQIRWLLAATGVSFVQRNIDTHQKFLMVKASLPFGKVPYLQIDGVGLVETQSILRYLAKRAGIDGKTELEKTVTDVYVESIRDMIGPVMGVPFMRYRLKNDKVKLTEFKETMIDTFHKNATNFEQILTRNGGLYLVGDSMTWADILLVHALTWYVEELGTEIMQPFPALIDLQNSIINVPNVKRFIRSTLFYDLAGDEYCKSVETSLGRNN